jgi:hypothetical protein
MSDSFVVSHSDKGENLEELLDWNYEIPPMFFPLFSAKPTYRSKYLYCEAEEGYRFFTEMYEFLEKHKDIVFERPQDFVEYKSKILKEVEPLGDHYYLSGEIIFSIKLDIRLNGLVLTETKKVYAAIENVNDQIKAAMASDDVEKFLGITTENGYACQARSLAEWFNDENYMYGYAPLASIGDPSEAKRDDFEIYTENDKQGLAHVDGKIITEALYDEIYDFAKFCDFAVVKLGDKYGYIDKKGHQCIALMYEQAFDFWAAEQYFSDEGVVTSGLYRAIVALDGKYGVIDEKNNVVIPCTWDDIDVISEANFIPDFYSLKKNGKIGIYDLDGKEKFPVIIDELHLGVVYKEFLKTTYQVRGFSGCLWARVGESWFYLNNKFQPYGHGLHVEGDYNPIIGKSVELEDGLKSEQNIWLFTVRNDAGFWGLISCNDDILVPLKYKNVKNLDFPGVRQGKCYFQAIGEGWIEVYAVAEDLSVEILFSQKCKRIKPLESNIIEVTAHKKGLFDLDNQKYILSPDYDFLIVLFLGSESGFIFAKDGEDLHQYDPITLTPMELSVIDLNQALENSLVNIPKTMISWFDEFKCKASTRAIAEIFNNHDDSNFIAENLSGVDFSYPLSIYFSAEKIFNIYIDKNIDLDLLDLRRMELLYKAYCYHYNKQITDEKKQEEMGFFSYFTAYILNAKYDPSSEDDSGIENIKIKMNECLDIALRFVSNVHYLYIQISEFSVYSTYRLENYQLCIEYSNKLLKLIPLRRFEYEAREPKSNHDFEHLEKLKKVEDLCHYYLAKVYFSPLMTDYTLVKKHIELALSFGTWNAYEKKYMYAIAVENLETADIFMPVLEDFDKTSIELNEMGNFWIYVRYFRAYHEYHDRGDMKKARILIDEGLTVNATYAPLINLLKKIKEQNSIVRKLKGFFE